MQWRFPLKFSRTDRQATASECDEIEPLLSLYCDGMASTAESKRVESHLATCESCKKAHYWMRATYEVVSHRPVVTPPSDLTSRIQRAIAEEAAGNRIAAPVPVRMRFNPRPVYGLAAALLVAAVVIPLVRSTTTKTPAPVHVASNQPALVLPPVALHPTAPVVTAPVMPVRRTVHSTPAVRPNNVELATTATPHERRHPSSPAHDIDEIAVYHPPVHNSEPMHTMLASTHERHQAAPGHRSVVRRQPDDERVATNIVPSDDGDVIIGQPSTSDTTVPSTPVVAPAPSTPSTVVAAAVHHDEGVNDYLRDAALTVSHAHADAPARSEMVNMQEPYSDSGTANIVHGPTTEN